jgi:serine/threonine protein phosphatase PrpC
MHVEFWAASDIGCVRQRNEDAYLLDPELGLALVADGIGGQHRGDLAAGLACNVVREHLRKQASDFVAFRADPTLAGRQRVQEHLRDAVQLANAEVWRAGLALSRGRGMGCTLEASLILGDSAFLAHVGDARTYLVKDGTAFQLTEDHSVVQEKIRRGQITPEEARVSPLRNAITRAVGHLPSVRVDSLAIPFSKGQRLLACSDGVTRYLEPAEIAELAGPGDSAGVAEIIARCRARGGVDNITAVVIAADAAPRPVGFSATQLDELRGVAILETCTWRELRQIAAIAEWREAKTGRLLFREGQAADEVFFVLSGEVVITRNGLHLDTVLSGGVFGELALIEGTARTASALVTAEARLVVLSKARFEQLFRQDDALSARISGALLKRLAGIIRGLDGRVAGA